MPTDNRRVAAYLPQSISDRLQSYKNEHGLKGDSQAIIQILSQFFGVDSQVAHFGNSQFVERIEATENRLAQTEGLLSELKSELLKYRIFVDGSLQHLTQQLEELKQPNLQFSSKLLSDSKSSSLDERVPVPGQLEIQMDASNIVGEQPPKSRQLPEPMSGAALSARLGLIFNAVSKQKSKYKNNPQGFTDWTRKKDPEGFGWFYDPKAKRYYPELDLNQVNPDSRAAVGA